MVGEGVDYLKGPQCDLRIKQGYEREKKRIKERTTYLDHWGPPCTTNTHASRNPRRWKDEPYGRVQDADLMQDSVVQVRVGKLAMMKQIVPRLKII